MKIKVKITEKNFPYIVYGTGLALAIIGIGMLGLLRLHDIAKSNVEQMKKDTIMTIWNNRCNDIGEWLLNGDERNIQDRFNEMFNERLGNEIIRFAAIVSNGNSKEMSISDVAMVIYDVEHIGTSNRFNRESSGWKMLIVNELNRMKKETIQYHLMRGE